MSDRQPPPPARLQREIFLGALERDDAAEKTAYLEAACGDDVELRRSVENLLHEEKNLAHFMAEPVLQAAQTASPLPDRGHPDADVASVTERPGDDIGRYHLLQEIGQGGCGIVYRAEQQEPLRREVALKVIKLGMDTRQVIARFEAERQTLARMEHPNIAQVYDAGATRGGRPFFVMELVHGLKLTAHCEQHRLSIEQRLELFIQVCHGIQHAHQKGVIHRDIKPSNILVATHEGRFVPKIIDFGIAKAIHQQQLASLTEVSGQGQWIGTPAYMSPEQAMTREIDIDTRSDIYSLGALLYELLTGGTPFAGEALVEMGLDECRRTIREEQPARPSTRLAALPRPELNRLAGQRRSEARALIEHLRGELDWIVMKALEKDRACRYATASALAHDVEHYLANEPVEARPPSNWYSLQKLVQRHRAACLAAAGMTVTLLLGTGISVWQAIRARQAETQARMSERVEAQLRVAADRERERAKAQAGLARLNEYVADINLTQHSLDAGNYGRAVQLLRKHYPQAGEAEVPGFEWRYLWRVSRGDDHVQFLNLDASVRTLLVSPDGEWVAVGADGKLALWDLHRRALVRAFPAQVISAVFAANSRELLLSTTSEVRIIETGGWTERTLPDQEPGLLALTEDGRRLAVGSQDRVVVWDTKTWAPETTLRGARPPLAFSRDGKRLATFTQAGITVWDLGNSSQVVLNNSRNLFWMHMWDQLGQAAAFSPDGAFLVAPRNRPSPRGVFVLSLWDAQTGEELEGLPQEADHIEHTGTIASLAFSPDGATLATASMDHSIRLWDFRTKRAVNALHGHLSEVWTVAFSPDGRTLISGAKDGSVNLWTIPRERKQDFLHGPFSPIAFAKDGVRLAVLDRQRAAVVLLDPATREMPVQFQLERDPSGFPPRFALSADLKVLVEVLKDGALRLHGTSGETSVLRTGTGSFAELALSADGGQLITGGPGQPLRWWDLSGRTNQVLEGGLHHPLFSPSGKRLLLFRGFDQAELWDVATRSLQTTLKLEKPPGPAAAFSPDERLVAIASNPMSSEQTISFLDTSTGRNVGACLGHKQGISALAFTPDGRTLASASHDSTIKLWSVMTRQELLSFSQLGGTWKLLFSPDGTSLVGEQSQIEPGLFFYVAPPLDGTERAQAAATTP